MVASAQQPEEAFVTPVQKQRLVFESSNKRADETNTIAVISHLTAPRPRKKLSRILRIIKITRNFFALAPSFLCGRAVAMLPYFEVRVYE
jgi:hypothetical protein